MFKQRSRRDFDKVSGGLTHNPDWQVLKPLDWLWQALPWNWPYAERHWLWLVVRGLMLKYSFCGNCFKKWLCLNFFEVCWQAMGIDRAFDHWAFTLRLSRMVRMVRAAGIRIIKQAILDKTARDFWVCLSSGGVRPWLWDENQIDNRVWPLGYKVGFRKHQEQWSRYTCHCLFETRRSYMWNMLLSKLWDVIRLVPEV